MELTTAEQEADRITQLLDVALMALKANDADGAILALEEALKTVEALPTKVET